MTAVLPTIVTSFFDIGRTNWDTAHGFPHYVQRSTDLYFERFSYLANKVKNQMVIFTDENLVERIKDTRKVYKDSTIVVPYNFKQEHSDLLHKIAQIQQSDAYKVQINPHQAVNPEYRIPEYVLVNWIKTHLVNEAIKKFSITDSAAWIDFGYCRNKSDAGLSTEWNPRKLNKNLINFLAVRMYDSYRLSINDIIFNNVVYTIGSFMYTSVDMWPNLLRLINQSMNTLLDNSLVDDDQTIMLMSSLAEPLLFSITEVDSSNQFVGFTDNRIVGSDIT